jgi:hypothetical protein
VERPDACRLPAGPPHRVAPVLVALALLVSVAFPASAGDAARLDGAVLNALTLDAGTLEALPRITVAVDFATGKGRERGAYIGARLWDLVQKAGLRSEGGKNADLRRTLLVTGRDGYAVALALGEIDPHYAGKVVILAYGGGQLPSSTGSLRLIVPGDAHGGRNVRDVVRIEVK